MAVQPNQRQVLGTHDGLRRPMRRPSGQRETKLLVLMAGGDELVGVRLHAGLYSDHDFLDTTGLGGDSVQRIQLPRCIKHYVANAGVDTQLQKACGLVIAVGGDPFCRESRS